jgi:hypothetical protein
MLCSFTKDLHCLYEAELGVQIAISKVCHVEEQYILNFVV